MPMPVAAALYGVLLGLGFTTFVLTFGVWALAGISFALGEPALGLALGLGFGLGRALPIVTLAPIADRSSGRAAVALMANRPGLYRGIRLGDAAALTAAAALLVVTGAEADVKRVKGGADPSVSGGDLVNQRGTSRAGQLRTGQGSPVGLPGTDPAIGGGNIAVIQGGDVVVLAREDLSERDRVTVAGADAVDVSGDWLAIRARVDRRDRLQVRRLTDGQIGAPRNVAAAKFPQQIGRPSLGGTRLAYAAAKRARNKLVLFNMTSNKRRTVINTPRHGIANPSLHGKKILYVRSTRRRDQLRVRKLGRGRERVLRSTRKRLWSTALTKGRAYVTILRGAKPRTRIVSVKR
jgi:hypothetical protein